MEKKYQFTGEQKVVSYGFELSIHAEEKRFVLNRIQAVRSFGDVTAGDLGGWIYSEANLSHDGNAWVGDEAYVSDKAVVCDNARVFGQAKVISRSKVCGNAVVCDESLVEICSVVSGDALVMGNSTISYNVIVTDNAIVEDSYLCPFTYIHDNATIKDFDCIECRLNIGGEVFINSRAAFEKQKDLLIQSREMVRYESVLSIVDYWLLHDIMPYGYSEFSLTNNPAEFSKSLENFLLGDEDRLQDAIVANFLAEDPDLECRDGRIDKNAQYFELMFEQMCRRCRS